MGIASERARLRQKRPSGCATPLRWGPRARGVERYALAERDRIGELRREADHGAQCKTAVGGAQLSDLFEDRVRREWSECRVDLADERLNRTGTKVVRTGDAK